MQTQHVVVIRAPAIRRDPELVVSLQSKNSAVRRTRSWHPGSIRTTVARDPAEITIVEEEVSLERMRALQEETDVLGVAPAMPVSVIAPYSARNLEASDASVRAWGIEAVGALEAGPDAGSEVVVAVLDTGIRADHPSFAGLRLEVGDNVRNYTDDLGDDLDGHGTHCAATIFGRDVGGVRIGIARGVRKVLIGKVLGKGGGSTQTVYKAMTWAIAEGAHVISMSLGLDFVGFQQQLVDQGYSPQQAVSCALAGYRANIRLFDALSNMLTVSDGAIQGTVVVAAAGNESMRPRYAITVAPPAAGDKFLSVGALVKGASPGDPLTIASFSNDEVRCAAPGEDILSASLDGGLKIMSGTSMAAPHVAGVAALWIDHALRTGGFRASRVLEAIQKRADPLPHLHRRDVGWGMPMAPGSAALEKLTRGIRG